MAGDLRSGAWPGQETGPQRLVVPHISDCPSPCPLPQVLRGQSRRSGEARTAKDLGEGVLPRRGSCRLLASKPKKTICVEQRGHNVCWLWQGLPTLPTWLW